MQPPSFNLDCLYGRASELKDHAALNSRSQFKLVEKPIKFDDIDPKMFSAVLSRHDPPSFDHSVDDLARNIHNVLYKWADASRIGNQKL